VVGASVKEEEVAVRISGGGEVAMPPKHMGGSGGVGTQTEHRKATFWD